MRKLFSILTFILISIHISGQIKLPSGYAESSLTGGFGKELPFWMLSNNYGVYSTYKDNLFIRSAVFSDLAQNKRFDYSYGVDAFGRYDNAATFSLHQAYLQAKIFFFTLQAGKKEEHFGDQDSTLSSGGFAWSGNAPPIPSIAVYVNHYTPVPFTHGYLEFKGGLVHGWFGNQYLAKNSYLHHKYIGLQAGGDLPVHIHFEFHDYAEWGGSVYHLGKQPSDLKAYYDVFFARETQIDSVFGQFLPNTLGNHLGNRNFGLDYKFSEYTINTYWQNYFEDNDGFHWRSIKDGLWGLVIKNKRSAIISKFLYEFFHSSNQSGPSKFYTNAAKLDEDFFNHYVYRFGWTYNKYTLGSPLITSPKISGNNIFDNIRNNRIIAHHFGLEGIYGKINYKILYTYSLNYGTYLYPFVSVKAQHSFLLDTNYPELLTFHLDLGIKAGFDRGTMYGNNFAINLDLRKRF